MAFIRYIPEPGTPAHASQFGIAFGPEPVIVNDARIIAKCKGSPFYEVMDSGAPSTPAAPSAEIGLRAIHNGGGRYIVVRGDKDAKVMEGLSKADAEAFNALSEDDKSAYVDKPAE